MPSHEERARELEGALHEACTILGRHGENWWASRLEDVLPLIQRRDSRGLKQLLGMYGGMGSINDLLIMRANGHQVSEAEEDIVNAALRSCLDRVHELADELYREVR